MIAGIRLFGLNLQELRRELLALADIHRDDFVFEPGLFEKNRDLVPVRCWPIVQVNHFCLLRAIDLTVLYCGIQMGAALNR